MQRMIDESVFEGQRSDIVPNEPNIPYSTPIKDFYRGKCVLLTGGTGFIGRLLVEKLLRIGVSKIYLVARPKKTKTALERIQELAAGPIFDRLRKLDPDFVKRIRPVDGDLVEPNLGLSSQVQNEFIANVQIILHAAADVRFDETLKNAIKVNIRATRDLLDLAKKMTKLEVIVHVSTAYSNCPLRVIDEKFYEPQCDPRCMIELAEKLDRKELEEEALITLTPKIIRPWPNTYSFTKALCEDMVKDYGEELPITMVRPSIVVGTNEDPIPGWTDNIYGLNGILTACALGLLRALHLNKDYIGDIVPADFVSNTILAAAWDRMSSTHEDSDFSENYETLDHFNPGPFKTTILNCTTSKDNPVTWSMINKDMRRMYEIYPPKRGIWVNCFNYTSSRVLFRLQVIFYHFLPSLIGDIFLGLANHKLRLLPIYRKVQGFIVALGYFTTNQWIFHNENMRKLCAKLSPDDANYFPCDVRRMRWMEYIHLYGKGLRMYIGKESMDTLAEGKRKKLWLQTLHKVIVYSFYAAVLALLYYILRAYHIIDPILAAADPAKVAAS